jgi:hypothetical protein
VGKTCEPPRCGALGSVWRRQGPDPALPPQETQSPTQIQDSVSSSPPFGQAITMRVFDLGHPSRSSSLVRRPLPIPPASTMARMTHRRPPAAGGANSPSKPASPVHGPRCPGKPLVLPDSPAVNHRWMACCTQEEIAEVEDVHKDSVSEICRKMAELPKSDKSYADHATDFDPPIYNIWKQQTKTEGASAGRDAAGLEVLRAKADAPSH